MTPPPLSQTRFPQSHRGIHEHFPPPPPTTTSHINMAYLSKGQPGSNLSPPPHPRPNSLSGGGDIWGEKERKVPHPALAGACAWGGWAGQIVALVVSGNPARESLWRSYGNFFKKDGEGSRDKMEDQRGGGVGIDEALMLGLGGGGPRRLIVSL